MIIIQLSIISISIMCVILSCLQPRRPVSHGANNLAMGGANLPPATSLFMDFQRVKV